ncbi:Neutral ceramidase [Mycena venus]|uniref:Neutral ceramidase n=1 Tax=Mycena venus TaxID=2733690 RepID=A0A8H6U140_9AGAR|nr:Neutral ceramidase [Mycena venus]
MRWLNLNIFWDWALPTSRAPLVETNMMGYASLGQTDSGPHQRQRGRAFIVGETATTANRIVLANADIAMGGTGIRRAILASLAAVWDPLYRRRTYNFGTHQHSG